MNTVKRTISAAALALCGLALAPATAMAQAAMQPYVLAYEGAGDAASEASAISDKLTAAGFEVIGRYQPYPGAEVICVTSNALKTVAASEANGAFAAVARVGVTTVGGKTQVSYQNLTYLAAAYRLKTDLADVATAMETALGASKKYGTEKGRSAKDLKDYHYMVGMEYFDDFYDLASYKSHDEGVKMIEANLAKGVGGSAQVYKLTIPGKDITVFGVSRAKVSDKAANDKVIMADTVDKAFDIKTTAYLPYEIVVDGKEARALHMRFRMAVWHPDLTMGTFSKIISSPGAIETLLKDVAGGKKKSTF